MKFLDIFKKTTESKEYITDSFPNYVKTAIDIISKSDNFNDNAFFAIIHKICTNDFEAKEIYIFLPIAFVRQWLPQINWPETYSEIDLNGIDSEKRYDMTASYLIIQKITQHYFANNPSKDTIMQIAGRSSEFNAINQLFLNSNGDALEDINITNTVIRR